MKQEKERERNRAREEKKMNKTIDKLLYIQIFLIRAIFNGLKFLEKKYKEQINWVKHQQDEKMGRRSQQKKIINNKYDKLKNKIQSSRMKDE